MTDMYLLSEDQMARISPFFPVSHGVPRVDDRRVISGIIFVIRNGLRWRDVPASYGPHKTIYNRFIRWSEMGVFGRIFVELAKGGGDTDEIMIPLIDCFAINCRARDATHPLPGSGLFANHERVKAHRTAASLLKKGFPAGNRSTGSSPDQPSIPGLLDAQKAA